jgi:hypothetical protein
MTEISVSHFPNRGGRGRTEQAMFCTVRSWISGSNKIFASPRSETRLVSCSLCIGVLYRGEAAEAKNAWSYTSTSRVSLYGVQKDNLAIFSRTDPQTHLPHACSSKREISYTRQFVHSSSVPQRNEPCLILDVV